MNTGLGRAARLLLCAYVLSAAPFALSAQNKLTIDATGAAPSPGPLPMTLHDVSSPTGEVLGGNSQFLTLDGKPWFPVMGEFHYSRYAESDWEREILKMKAAGVDIISTYIIWIHHEQVQGQFDWSGQRDLRRFVELCGKHGLYVFARVGPWVHGEVRNGGLPDWVLKNSPTRENNPTYLGEVNQFYKQIGTQLQGELWKDGGPVIGVQLENEYNLSGPVKGADHIHTLKQLALDAGLRVPFFTVTGWDGAAVPLDAVLPVFGGYPDAPWAGTPGPMYGNEIYQFRFNNRAAGNMGALGGKGQNAAETYRGTPFLTAEVGDGIEDTYFRRPVVSTDDVAAIPTVILGSGANLLGYYMFHGGRNPDAKGITLQESQRTAYPTDVPVRSYDFQAPLGEAGQVRESLLRLKLLHYFLHDFGSTLAPMLPHAPDHVPSSPADTSGPRVAARTAGDTGFLFFNNHLRGLPMPARPGFQVALKLPGQTLQLPEQPIDLPADSYGIWPVNLPLGPATLRYSTAQLFKRVTNSSGISFWFCSLPGIVPEFSLPAHTAVLKTSPGVRTVSGADAVRIIAPQDTEATIQLSGGVTLVVLPRNIAEQVWRVDDPAVLVRSAAMTYSNADTWTLEAETPEIALGVFGNLHAPIAQAPASLHTQRPGSVFQSFTAKVPAVSLSATVKQERTAGTRSPWQQGPSFSWRAQPIAMAPDDKEFDTASRWSAALPSLPWSGALADVLLDIRYQGDVARLSLGGTLLDDNFWNGKPWQVGLRELLPSTSASGQTTSLQLQILPLPQNHPMYLEAADQLSYKNGAADRLDQLKLTPLYRFTLQEPTVSGR